MPRLKCTFAVFIAIIEERGFTLHRHGGGSHRRYRGVVNGEVRFVDVAYHNVNEHPSPKTLASMIRQSGLPANLFRK